MTPAPVRVSVTGADRLYTDLLIRSLSDAAEIAILLRLPDAGEETAADVAIVLWSRRNQDGLEAHFAAVTTSPTLLLSSRPPPEGTFWAPTQWCSLHASTVEVIQLAVSLGSRHRRSSPARGASAAGAQGAPLTPRELHVLRLLVDGDSTLRIAQELGISTATVRGHVSSVLAKLGVNSRLKAAARAVEQHLV